MAINIFEIKGQLTNEKLFTSEKDSIPRLNLTIKTRDNENDKFGQYVQAVITSQKKIDLFNELNKDKDISIKGRAHFYKSQKDGVQNFNVSLLANEFKQAEEKDLSNHLRLNGTLGNKDINILQNKKGEDFGVFQMAQNEFYNNEQQPANWLNVVIPVENLKKSEIDSIKATKPVVFEGKYQQRNYKDKNGKKVYTLNLIADKVSLNLKFSSKDKAVSSKNDNKDTQEITR